MVAVIQDSARFDRAANKEVGHPLPDLSALAFSHNRIVPAGEFSEASRFKPHWEKHPSPLQFNALPRAADALSENPKRASENARVSAEAGSPAHAKNGAAASPFGAKILPFKKHSSRQVKFHGVNYASCEEAACGAMLLRYLKGFRIKEGETFQIPITDPDTQITRTIDFQVNGFFLEYHPPRFWREGRNFGDFSGWEEFKEYRSKVNACRTKQQRKALKLATCQMLARRYEGKRRKVIDGNPETRGRPLIVVGSCDQLYHKVICAFLKNPPSQADFRRAFKAAKKLAAVMNPHTKNKAGRTRPYRRSA